MSNKIVIPCKILIFHRVNSDVIKITRNIYTKKRSNFMFLFFRYKQFFVFTVSPGLCYYNYKITPNFTTTVFFRQKSLIQCDRAHPKAY